MRKFYWRSFTGEFFTEEVLLRKFYWRSFTGEVLQENFFTGEVLLEKFDLTDMDTGVANLLGNIGLWKIGQCSSVRYDLPGRQYGKFNGKKMYSRIVNCGSI